MARPVPEKELQAIEDIVRRHPGGVSSQEIAESLPGALPLRTLQYRLRRLVEQGSLAKEGERRWTKYHIPAEAGQVVATAYDGKAGDVIPLSNESAAIRGGAAIAGRAGSVPAETA